jgi:ABC-type glycerol-3-phosphate transport system substrate-binding protein
MAEMTGRIKTTSGRTTRRRFLKDSVRTGMVVLAMARRSSAAPAAGTTIQIALEAGTAKTKNVLDGLPEFKRQTGIDVRPVEIPLENQREKVMTDMLSGRPQFDVAQILGEAYVPQFAAAKLLEPMEKHVGPERLADLSPLARKLSSYEGQLYGWPWFEHTVGILYFRTDLFKEAGLTDAAGKASPPETWEQYVDAAKRLTRGDVYGTLVEAKRDQEPFWRFLGLVWQAGGDILDEQGKVVIDSPEAAEALQYQVDLIHKHKVSPPGSFTYYNVDNHTLFTQGKLGMTENWPYMIALAKNPAQSRVVDKFAVAPTIGHRRRTWSTNGFTWVVPKNARHKDEAIEFLRWVTSRPMLIDLARRYQLPMTRRSLKNAPELAEFKHMGVVAQAIEMGRSIPLTPKWAEIRDAIIDEWQAGLLLKKTPREAMRSAGERVRRIVSA